jgi:predicted PurR-regulated permease PerM
MLSPPRAGRFLVLLVVAATVVLALIIRPLAAALLVAAVLAGLLWPLQQRFAARLGGRRRCAAAILVFVTAVALVGPAVGLSIVVVRETAEGVRLVATVVRGEGVQGLSARLPGPAARVAEEALALLLPTDDAGNVYFGPATAEGGQAAMRRVITATGALVFQTGVMLVALFFLLCRGHELVIWLDQNSPLPRGQTRELLIEFKRVSRAVVASSVIVAVLQAAVALVGYVLAQLPHPIFFAGVTLLAALIPLVGAALICEIAALMLYLLGHPYPALFLAIWGVAVVGLVDNFVKPLLIEERTELPSALLFFALVGGLTAFGPVGLLVGPLALALFLASLRMLQRQRAPAVTPTTFDASTRRAATG